MYVYVSIIYADKYLILQTFEIMYLKGMTIKLKLIRNQYNCALYNSRP